eukprot:9624173-Alexandrium_andersonii.AAC.1
MEPGGCKEKVDGDDGLDSNRSGDRRYCGLFVLPKFGSCPIYQRRQAARHGIVGHVHDDARQREGAPTARG